MADLKISQFVDGNAIQVTDEIATNRAGVNTKVKVGSAAALDAGAAIGDVPIIIDDGAANPALPPLSGAFLTDVETSADLISYTPASGSSISSDNVQGAIDELESDLDDKLENITGLITAGDGISISGSGTSVDPYEIESSSDENLTTANTGTSYAINFDNGPNFLLTLTGNCTFTFTNPPSPSGSFSLVLKQDGSGSKSVTWPASVAWAGGSAPTISSGANEVDVFTFYTVDGGTIWFGFMAGKDMS